jgi:hypothetical protein
MASALAQAGDGGQESLAATALDVDILLDEAARRLVGEVDAHKRHAFAPGERLPFGLVDRGAAVTVGAGRQDQDRLHRPLARRQPQAELGDVVVGTRRHDLVPMSGGRGGRLRDGWRCGQ